jgi:energy-coupling factor transport system ATP-binding protein
MSQGQVVLDGNANEVLGQDEILATTYVDPPQLTRLGKRLGLKKTVRNEKEFLAEYQAGGSS